VWNPEVISAVHPAVILRYAATAADAIIEQRAKGGWKKLRLQHINTGEANLAYTSLGSGSAGADFVTAIGFDLPKDLTFMAAELGFAAQSSLVVWHRGGGASKATKAAAVTLKKCAKADFQLAYVTAAAGGGVTLLGEEGKIVPHSAMRFSGLKQGAGSASVGVAGVKGEVVAVSFFVEKAGAGGGVVSVECHFASSATMVAAHSASGNSCK